MPRDGGYSRGMVFFGYQHDRDAYGRLVEVSLHLTFSFSVVRVWLSPTSYKTFLYNIVHLYEYRFAC